jgi:hypothetical protein
MRITMLLIALLAASAPAFAMQQMSPTRADAVGLEVTCKANPDGAECGFCSTDPSHGDLPISIGGRVGIGVGVASPQDIENGEPYGPYEGLYYSSSGC